MDEQYEDVQAVHDGKREPTLHAVARQSEELEAQDARKITVTCPCGDEGPIMNAYSCRYCGVWFCPDCAIDHFMD